MTVDKCASGPKTCTFNSTDDQQVRQTIPVIAKKKGHFAWKSLSRSMSIGDRLWVYHGRVRARWRGEQDRCV